MTSQEPTNGGTAPQVWPDMCGECIYYGGSIDAERAPCKRYPPQVSRGMSQWPEVNATDDVCGEGLDKSLIVDDDPEDDE